MLGQLVRTLGQRCWQASPAAASASSCKSGKAREGAEPSALSPADAVQVTPEQVRDIAIEAQKKDPTVLDRIGEYYAQHPEVVKVLGGAALAIALGQVAERMKR